MNSEKQMFEKRRKEMLSSLSKVKSQKIQEKKIARKKVLNPSSNTITTPQKKEIEIVVYGNESFFIRNLTQSLKSHYHITKFDNEEKACNYCIEKNINYILVDMDLPTDWRKSTDLFTTVKMGNPDAVFFLATSDYNSVPAQTLKNQGGKLFEKPLEINDLKSYIEMENLDEIDI